MTFALQYIAKANLSQQFDNAYNPATGCAAHPIPQFWCYDGTSAGGNSNAAAIQASGYFNGASGYLHVGDLIWATATDTPHLIYVATNSSGTVTTTQLI
jgi:hypothetical protein